jgi:DAK2 domain fusion protein YloV
MTAADLREAFRVAEQWLSLNRDAINAVNVYPVPDGDTGTNMLLTLRASMRGADAETGSVGAYAAAMARAALLGARGNSGVILSQMLRGVAEGYADRDKVDGAALAAALVRGAEAAYEAVSQPVEGTMLTVMRDAAEAARSAAEAGAPLPLVLRAAAIEADASVERTPTLLARLREAGVVDAGGLGIAVLLHGLRYGCAGEPLPDAPETPAGVVQLDAVEHEGHGYCTEFVVLGADIDRPALERELEAAGGDSILVVGDAQAVHVHVHLADPGPALSAGARLGALDSVKVDNMQAQHEAWTEGLEAARSATASNLPEYGLVAVAAGVGLASAFRALGVGVVVDGGPTSNPSAGELIEAAERAASRHAFILPNDGNVVMAARQAALARPGFVTVIDARSLATGFAAAVAFMPEGTLEEMGERMAGAMEGVHCVEVTRSVRDTSADGVKVAAGDAIALVDGRLVARADDLEAALLEGLGRVAGDAEVAAVYLGADAERDAEAVRALIEEAFPNLEVDVIRGDQPHYPYVVGVE